MALDEKEYELDPDDLVIADHERALAIAGVMGGEQSGVTATTTDMLLEAAYFNPGFIRRTSRRLGLISESSFRFERGVDPEAVLLASARATDLLLEVAGGKADESVVIGGIRSAFEPRGRDASGTLHQTFGDGGSRIPPGSWLGSGSNPPVEIGGRCQAIDRTWFENRT